MEFNFESEMSIQTFFTPTTTETFIKTFTETTTTLFEKTNDATPSLNNYNDSIVIITNVFIGVFIFILILVIVSLITWIRYKYDRRVRRM
jgi:hypothetical protein